MKTSTSQTHRISYLLSTSLILLAAWVMSSASHAHHDEYQPSKLAQASPDSETESEDAAAVPSSQTVSEVDRQAAFSEFEMLMHLALRAPTPHQQAAIDLGFANHHLVEATPGAPSLEQLQALRSETLDQLRSDLFVCPVVWNKQGITLPDATNLQLAAGLKRNILLEVDNRTATYIDLSVKQVNDQQAPATKYTIHPGTKTLVPVELLATSIDDVSLQLEFTAFGESPLVRQVDLPVAVQQPATLRGRILDADLKKKWPGRVYVLGSDRVFRHGKMHAGNETLSQKQLLQAIESGRYYKLPFFYSDGTFEIQVPPGKTEVTLERGFEHEVVSKTVELEPGETREVELTSGRIRDMQRLGWVSGDTHVHWVTNQWNVDLPLELLATVQRAEDLRVANNLTLLQRGPSLAFINPSQAPMGTVEQFSDDQYHIEMGEEYRNEDLYLFDEFQTGSKPQSRY